MRNILLVTATAGVLLLGQQQTHAQYYQGNMPQGMSAAMPGAAPGGAAYYMAQAAPGQMPGQPAFAPPGQAMYMGGEPGGPGAYEMAPGGGEPCPVNCCPAVSCAPQWAFFGEFLYLRPRNSEITFGIPLTSLEEGLPAGRVGTVDIDYEPAYRIGFMRGIDSRSTIGATYTRFHSDSSNLILESPVILSPFTIPPSLFTDGASASYFMEYDLIDMDYRWAILCTPRYSFSILAGARYAHFEQDFRSEFAVPTTVATHSNIRFEGGGVRIGLEGERHAGDTGVMVYGRGVASFVAGNHRALFTEETADVGQVVDSAWKAGRLVSMLDLEVGVGWTGLNDHLRVTAGYLVSSWRNIIKTDRFIQAVQDNNFTRMNDTLNWDGFTARAEVRF
jgi:hypothetical protein